MQRAKIGSPPTGADKPRSFGHTSRLGRTKRAVFPSTLWESGRAACRGFDPGLITEQDTVVLHTTYLGPLAKQLREHGNGVVLDVYDLIWRVHRIDASLATNRLISATRRVYSDLVRIREERCLRAAHVLPTAGWTDLEHVRTVARAAFWNPTGVPAQPVATNASDRLRVGLIGHFGHSATVDAAEALLASPLGRDANTEVVIAGVASEQWGRDRPVTSLGRVDSITDFYERIDAAVVPVLNGSGMKCKLAESAMSGKTTVTTAAGAEGFPPELSAGFVVLSLSELTADAVRLAASGNVENAARAFVERVGTDGAVASYRLTCAKVSANRQPA